MQMRNQRGLSVFIARKAAVYDMYENTKGVKALGTVLRQKLEVSLEIPAEMLVLLLRLARADMARCPPPAGENVWNLGSGLSLVADPHHEMEPSHGDALQG